MTQPSGSADRATRQSKKNRLDIFSIMHNHMVVDYLGATFAALSDPTRRLIIDRLTRGPASVTELAEPFSISQQAVSKHLAYLENAYLIERQRDGRRNFCALKPEAIRTVAKWADGFRSLWEKRFQSLDVLLEEMKTKPAASRLRTRVPQKRSRAERRAREKRR